MPRLSFNVQPMPSVLDNLTLYEKIDKAVLIKLINSSLLKETFNNKVCRMYANEKAQLMEYLKLMKYNKIAVTYSKNKNNKYGRCNPAKALGLYPIRREIRHTLCADSKVDLDADNCHPVMLNQLCEAEGVNHAQLDRYVKNREEYFTEGMRVYGCTREQIKILMIIYCYGGGIQKWVTVEKVDISKCLPEAVNNNKIVEIPMMKEFHDSMAEIHRAISMKNPDLCDIVIKNKKEQDITEFNLFGTVCSFVLQEYEVRVLGCIYSYCVANKIILNGLCVLCADGMMIEKDKYKPELLDIFTDIVRREVGFELKFSKKEMVSGYLDILDKSIIKEEDRVEKDDADALFKKMSAEFELTHTKILNRSLFVKKIDDSVIFMTKKDLLTSYEHVQCGINRNGNPESFIKRWTTCNNSINVKDDMENYPDVDNCPSNIFNLWTPFAMEKYTDAYEHDTEALNFMLNHIRVLCGNDDLVHNYFVNWIAKMIQQPYKKLPCIVLISDEGAGKGSLMKLLSKMMGDKKVFETSNPSRDVWGHFNELMMDAFLVNLNELEFSETQSAEGKIKALITDTQMTINPKGIKAMKINSYHHYIVTTNNDNSMKSKKGDRRKLISRSSDEFKGNTTYFNKMHKILEDNIVIRTCYDYFKNHDITGFDETVMPTTEFQDDLKELSVTAPEQWLKDFTIKKRDEQTVELLGSEIYTRFTMWCNTNNKKYDTDPLKLGIKLKNLKIDGLDKGRHTNRGDTKIMNIEKLKKHFNVGCLIEL
jgi:Family of unknown function (DUF5906)